MSAQDHKNPPQNESLHQDKNSSKNEGNSNPKIEGFF